VRDSGAAAVSMDPFVITRNKRQGGQMYGIKRRAAIKLGWLRVGGDGAQNKIYSYKQEKETRFE
jgi:hypothetical protein